MGLEGVTSTSSVREDPLVTDGDAGSGPDAGGPSRTQLVASLATRLAEAVVAGDQEQARALAEELRALQAGPAARPLRRAR
jgi:delta 1-pyrroline-5-carboxylate dehydrogenase